MKKVLLFGSVALFSLALVTFTSCSKDDDDTCVTCTEEDGTDYEVCWSNDLDAISKLLEFSLEHPDAECEDY